MDYLYDPECTYIVTINLQLLLCNLIESFELNGFDVLSANTDGLLIRRPNDRLDLFNHICKEWEDYSKLSLDTKYLKSIVEVLLMIILLLDMVSMTLYKSIIVVVSGLILKAILILHVKLLKINLLSLKVIFFKTLNTIKVLFYPVVKKALKEYFLYGVDITGIY